MGLLLTTAQTLNISRIGHGQNLDRQVAPESRIAGSVDFTHSPRAERRENFVRAEFGTRGQSHVVVRVIIEQNGAGASQHSASRR